MIFWRIIYNLILLPLLFAVFCFGSLFNGKIRAGMIGRFRSYQDLKSFRVRIGIEKTIYWFHASSHGEFEQVKPVLAGLKEVEPFSFSVVSFFSPSGYNHVNDEHIDCKIYLPFDFPWLIRKCLNVVQPKKIILAAYDVWPNMIWVSKSMDIHSALFAAQFSEGTSKLSPVIRNFYRNVYGSLSAIYTISEQDNKSLQRILYPIKHPIVRVLGNPRYDQVKQKADKFTSERTESVLLRPKRLLAGSIHLEDEHVILDSIVNLMQDISDLSLIWVPHEPSDRIVSEAEFLFRSKNFTTGILDSKNPNEIEARVIIVDTIGKLSQLYWDVQVAYILSLIHI